MCRLIFVFQRREVIRQLVLRYLARKSCHSGIETESNDSDEEYDNEAAASFTTNGLEISPKAE